MSRNSSPGHSTPNSMDSFYDTAFTAEITSKMRVPDKICLIEGSDPPDLILPHHSDCKTKMNVPERILVAGDNKHFAVREFMPEYKFDTPFPINLPNNILPPPPNVLTVDEYPVEAKRVEKTEVKATFNHAQDILGITDMHETSLNTSVIGDDELAKLKVQLRHLSRRVFDLEQENQQRQHREILMCLFGGAYVVIKCVLWLNRRL